MSCTVGIFYTKKSYAIGEIVSGYVILHITGVFAVESIILSVSKESGIQIEEKGENEVSNEKAIRHLGRFIIYQEKNKKMERGTHKFPFQFRMIQGEGSTVNYVKATEERRISIVNRYMSKCEVKIFGIYKPVALSEKEITITENSSVPQRKEIFHELSVGCLCFETSFAGLFLEMDTLLYAGGSHEVKITTDKGETITEALAVLEMCIKSFSSPPIRLFFPCRVVPSLSSFFIEVDCSLPSDSSKGEFFSISYSISFMFSGKSIGKTRISQEIGVRSMQTTGEHVPADIPESSIYPEKHLALRIK
ncbi:hypothetical protein NEFER02_0785 [Nematocida sp. LUAm2]|nr:hypothetical protein NEFER02_0785 [Nematocida sp. LUAm2]